MSRLFDVERLIKMLADAGVALLRSPPAGGSAWRPALPLAPLNCYLKYLELRRRGCLPVHELERVVYRALTPVQSVREAVEAERRGR